MDIPIRFQQGQQSSYQQPQTSSWGSQQGYQPQQQPSWQQQQQQPSSWTQQQQKPGAFSSVPEQGVEQQQAHQLPKYSQGIESQKYGQGIESQKYGQQGQISHQQQSQIGQVVQKEIRADNVSAVDLTTLVVLLRVIGRNLVKEHAMCKLADDKSGLLKKFHDEVTVKNFEFLSNLAKQWGVTLPFPVNPEQRAHEVYQALANAPKIFTEGELLMDICMAAHVLEPIFACGLMNGTDEELHKFLKNATCTLCETFQTIKSSIKNTDQDYCVPLVKTVITKEGVSDRR